MKGRRSVPAEAHVSLTGNSRAEANVGEILKQKGSINKDCVNHPPTSWSVSAALTAEPSEARQPQILSSWALLGVGFTRWSRSRGNCRADLYQHRVDLVWLACCLRPPPQQRWSEFKTVSAGEG